MADRTLTIEPTGDHCDWYNCVAGDEVVHIRSATCPDAGDGDYCHWRPVGELVPLSELADRHGYANGRSLRNFLARNGVTARDAKSGRGGADLYDEAEVQRAIDHRPRPPRLDLRKTTE